MAKPFFRWGKDDLSCGLYVRLVQYFMQSIFDKSLEFDLHIIHVLVQLLKMWITSNQFLICKLSPYVAYYGGAMAKEML